MRLPSNASKEVGILQNAVVVAEEVEIVVVGDPVFECSVLNVVIPGRNESFEERLIGRP